MGSYLHTCENDMVCTSISEKIPQPTAPIYLENKTKVGQVDEVFGSLDRAHFSVKMQEGFPAAKFSLGDKFYIEGRKTLTLDR